MTTLTPKYTFDVTANTVTAADGKAIRLADMAADGFDTLENLEAIEIRRCPSSESIEYSRLSDTFRDYVNRHIFNIRTIILTNPTEPMLIGIGQFAIRETATLRLKIENGLVPNNYNVPELEHLICSFADLQQFGTNSKLRRLALTTVGSGVELQLAYIKSVVGRNSELTRILCNCSTDPRIVIPNEVSKRSITTQSAADKLTDIWEALHSPAGGRRHYDYLMLADSVGVLSIDTTKRLLQTSMVGLIDRVKAAYVLDHLRVFIASEEVQRFCELLPKFTTSNEISSLYISVRKDDAEVILKTDVIKAFANELTIDIYDIDENTSEKIHLDNIHRENRTTTLFMFKGYFTDFIGENTESLQVYCDEQSFSLELCKFALAISGLSHLNRLDIHHTRLSQFVIEFAALDSYFLELEVLLLNGIKTSALQNKHSAIFSKEALKKMRIRNAVYESFLETSGTIKNASEWRIEFWRHIRYVKLDRVEAKPSE